MKLAVWNNYLGGQILYRSLDPPKKRRHSFYDDGIFLFDFVNERKAEAAGHSFHWDMIFNNRKCAVERRKGRRGKVTGSALFGLLENVLPAPVAHRAHFFIIFFQKLEQNSLKIVSHANFYMR